MKIVYMDAPRHLAEKVAKLEIPNFIIEVIRHLERDTLGITMMRLRLYAEFILHIIQPFHFHQFGSLRNRSMKTQQLLYIRFLFIFVILNRKRFVMRIALQTCWEHIILIGTEIVHILSCFCLLLIIQLITMKIISNGSLQKS